MIFRVSQGIATAREIFYSSFHPCCLCSVVYLFGFPGNKNKSTNIYKVMACKMRCSLEGGGGGGGGGGWSTSKPWREEKFGG